MKSHIIITSLWFWHLLCCLDNIAFCKPTLQLSTSNQTVNIKDTSLGKKIFSLALNHITKVQLIQSSSTTLV